MQLNRLCIILPTDLDDTEPSEPPKAFRKPKRRCTSQVAALIGGSLRRIYDLKWASLCRHDERSRETTPGRSVFHDLDGVQLSEKVCSDNPRIFSYSELYIGTRGFHEDGVLGSGGFGRVYRAALPSDGSVVAVKCLAEKGEQFEKTFAAELVAVAQLRHRNLVRLRGWCVHEDELLLVYDYMPNRSLDRVLFKRPDKSNVTSLSWERRRNIVGGLAEALHYLHEQLETQIIHRDVKTSNVMLDSHYNARLGDFGLARWLEHDLDAYTTNKTPSMRNHQFRLADSTRIGGTIGYLPPESFNKRSVATAKSDVFSFGIVVLEVVCGRRAVDLTYPDDQIVLLDWMRKLSDEKRVLQAGDSRLPDGSYALSDMERLIHLGLLCTLHNPQSRPTMKWVVESVSSNFSGKLPPLPSFHSHPRYVSFTSSSSSSTSNTKGTGSSSSISPRSHKMTITFTSSTFLTATEETIFATAEVEPEPEPEPEPQETHELSSSVNSASHRRSLCFVVETPREISYKEIVSSTHNFSDSRRLAEVDFGTAYYGRLDDGHLVFIKRLGMTKCPALVTRFSTELQNLGRLRHRNLIQLRGWCTEQGEMLVVYDYSANRLLSHLLFHNNHNVLKWKHRYNIINSLASAILYLHEEWDEQVIHRNITSSAIVLDPDMNPRLSNFALAEFLARNDHAHKEATKNNTAKSVRGIFGYMSPEYMESGEATTMADIYSFGVVILEVVTGQMAVDLRRPYALLVDRVHHAESQERPLDHALVDIKLNDRFHRKQLTRLIKLGIACTRSDPKLRPTMRQIVSILDGNDQTSVLRDVTTLDKERTRQDWKHENATSLSLVRRIQSLGVQ